MARILLRQATEFVASTPAFEALGEGDIAHTAMLRLQAVPGSDVEELARQAAALAGHLEEVAGLLADSPSAAPSAEATPREGPAK